MKAEETFFVVFAAACVIRHVLELLYVAFAKSDDDVSRRYCNQTRQTLVTTHGMSTLVYIITIAAFVVRGVPDAVGHLAVAVSMIGESVHNSWCPSTSN